MYSQYMSSSLHCSHPASYTVPAISDDSHRDPSYCCQIFVNRAEKVSSKMAEAVQSLLDCDSETRLKVKCKMQNFKSQK